MDWTSGAGPVPDRNADGESRRGVQEPRSLPAAQSGRQRRRLTKRCGTGHLQASGGAGVPAPQPEDVLAELPDLVRTDEWVEFGQHDFAAYREAGAARN